jgi:hypothetical protein
MASDRGSVPPDVIYRRDVRTRPRSFRASRHASRAEARLEKLTIGEITPTISAKCAGAQHPGVSRPASVWTANQVPLITTHLLCDMAFRRSTAALSPSDAALLYHLMASD